MIAWKYLDKKAAAVEAMKDYTAMKFIILDHEEDTEEVREKMTSIRSSAPTGVPHNTNPKAGETRLAAQIDEIDVLKERYRSAAEYMAWFKPAWDELSEDELFVLTEFYLNNDGSREESISNICDRFTIERTSAYKKKDRALAKLTVLLYGK